MSESARHSQHREQNGQRPGGVKALKGARKG